MKNKIHPHRFDSSGMPYDTQVKILREGKIESEMDYYLAGQLYRDIVDYLTKAEKRLLVSHIVDYERRYKLG